jgi:hypothetical protein
LHTISRKLLGIAELKRPTLQSSGPGLIAGLSATGVSLVFSNSWKISL